MYIAIEGVIGVGKTTLVRMLQPVFKANILLEVFEENPFLSDFYADRNRYAFQTQVFFLLSRYQQQHQAVPKALQNSPLIADYTFAKDKLFARINLHGDELATYDQVHRALADKIPLPELVVYLRADTNVLMQRITLRDRPYERSMEWEYIDALRQAYDDFLLTQASFPVLSVDTNELDFVKHRADFESIVAQMRAALAGTYQPQLPFTDMRTQLGDGATAEPAGD